ncbi:MAG: hypothetical protein ASARMPRED_003937 [Alectoria sarmentosa]|nr:MAG: hypothetical protein ASARMPRED_003937 [Alectoria sarmentosa]
MHAKYGEVVRIAPNELSFAKTEAWNDIYAHRPGHKEFPRNPVWWSRPPGQPSSFISADTTDHARMRRVLGNAFSEKALRGQEPIVRKYVRLLIERLRGKVQAQPDGAVVNIVDWYRYCTFDIIGDLNFDESFDCLSNGHYHWWIAGIFNVFKISAFLACIRFSPVLEKAFLKCVPKKMQDLQKEHYQAVVDKTQRRLKKGFERPDIMSYIMRNNGPNGMTIPEIESSMNVLCVGGSHNTSSTMSGITNYLVKNPACLQKLSNEVRTAHKSADEITFGSLQTLPYLSAVIEEGLRMAPPFPAGLPRCVPEGGDTVCGEWLPGGTHVQVNSWSLQRVSSAFAMPGEFLPERWLANSSSDSPFANDNKAASQQFSVGPRRCLGEALAYAEMRLMLGSMVYSFDIESVNSPAGRLDWETQKTYMVVEEEPFEVRLLLSNPTS